MRAFTDRHRSSGSSFPSVRGSGHFACSAPGACDTWPRGPPPSHVWPPAYGSAGDSWAQPGLLAVCLPRVKVGSPAGRRVIAIPCWLPSKSMGEPRGAGESPSPHFLAKAWSLGKPRWTLGKLSRWSNRRLTSCELSGASGLVDVVTVGCVCFLPSFLFLTHTKEGRSERKDLASA